MTKRMTRIIGALSVAAVLYLMSYFAFRFTHSEVWEYDKETYVIFPEVKILYYVYRPLTLADGKLTGMQFHIGPHQQNGNN